MNDPRSDEWKFPEGDENQMPASRARDADAVQNGFPVPENRMKMENTRIWRNLRDASVVCEELREHGVAATCIEAMRHVERLEKRIEELELVAAMTVRPMERCGLVATADQIRAVLFGERSST